MSTRLVVPFNMVLLPPTRGRDFPVSSENLRLGFRPGHQQRPWLTKNSLTLVQCMVLNDQPNVSEPLILHGMSHLNQASPHTSRLQLLERRVSMTRRLYPMIRRGQEEEALTTTVNIRTTGVKHYRFHLCLQDLMVQQDRILASPITLIPTTVGYSLKKPLLTNNPISIQYTLIRLSRDHNRQDLPINMKTVPTLTTTPINTSMISLDLFCLA